MEFEGRSANDDCGVSTTVILSPPRRTKDLPEYFGLDCHVLAPWPEFSWKSRESATKTAASREILRPTPGLGMTVRN